MAARGLFDPSFILAGLVGVCVFVTVGCEPGEYRSSQKIESELDAAKAKSEPRSDLPAERLAVIVEPKRPITLPAPRTISRVRRDAMPEVHPNMAVIRIRFPKPADQRALFEPNFREPNPFPVWRTRNIGDVRSVIFVVDASGSTMALIPFMAKELVSSIKRLTDDQSFAILFFNDDGWTEMGGGGLMPASLENRWRAVEWLSQEGGPVAAQGSGTPIPVMRRALSLEPELIILVGDRELVGLVERVPPIYLARQLAGMNEKKVPVSAIEFSLVRSNAIGAKLVTVSASQNISALRLIARLTGGRFMRRRILID